MPLKDFPSIKVRSEKITGMLFSLINSLFFIRFIWQLSIIKPTQKTIIIICGVLVIQILLVVIGLLPILSKKILSLIHLSGSPFILFIVFIFSKRLLKPIIADQELGIRAEISTWYLAIFLFLAVVILINFLRELSHRATDTLPKSSVDQSKSRFIKTSYYLVIVLLIGYWVYTQVINPLPIYSNYDPEFSYMLNSLTPFKDLELYARMDHPGTFLQIAGSLIAIILSPISILKDGYPYTYLINHPVAFIFSARFIILLLNIFTVRIIYKYFQYPKTWSESFAGASALVVYFATHTYSFTHLGNWSPNSFNFAVGTFVLVILYILIKNGKYKDLRTLWMVSVAIGLAATFQIYMVTIILCAIAALFFTSLFERNHWKDTLKYSAVSTFGAIAGYITGTLVILEHYSSFIRWIGNVIAHQGSYGSGTSGFVSKSNFLRNMVLLWNENPALFIFWFISLLVFILIFAFTTKKNQFKAPTWAFILGINLQILSLFILFGKQPGHRYLLSIVSLFPLIIISIAGLLDERSKLTIGFFSATFAGLLILLIANINNSISNHNELIHYYDSYQKELNTFRANQPGDTDFDSDNITYYWTYDTFSLCYSLWFGNDFSKTRFTNEILNMCPDDLQYDVWKNPLDNLEILRGNDQLNILILNNRYFKMVDDLDYINKIESSIWNLGFVIVE